MSDFSRKTDKLDGHNKHICLSKIYNWLINNEKLFTEAAK